MSNPAVVKLQRGTIGNSKVWLDDNFGESIHVHIDDFRIDLTTEEFNMLHDDICFALNDILQIDNFDISLIDPVYLSLWFWPNLSRISKVKIDYVKLEELLARHPDSIRILPLAQTVGVLALKGLSNDNEKYTRLSNHLGQNENERLLAALESIKKNGYPYNGQYIVVFGDDNLIRDGQHRASCLYYLYGNIEVPVLRIYLNGYKRIKLYKHYNSAPIVMMRNCAKVIYKYINAIKSPSVRLFNKLTRKVKVLIHNRKTKNFPPEESFVEIMESR